MLGSFKIQKFFSSLVAFYSPMMYAKRNSYAKCKKNQCEFGIPNHPFSDFGLAGWKNTMNEEMSKSHKGTHALNSTLHCENTHCEILTFLIHPTQSAPNKIHYNKFVFSQCKINFGAYILLQRFFSHVNSPENEHTCKGLGHFWFLYI